MARICILIHNFDCFVVEKNFAKGYNVKIQTNE